MEKKSICKLVEGIRERNCPAAKLIECPRKQIEVFYA
jgi:hypothetical protein